MVGQEEQEDDSGGALGIAEMAAALLEEEENGREGGDDGDDGPAPTCATGWTISGSLCYQRQTRTGDYTEAKVGTELNWY